MLKLDENNFNDIIKTENNIILINFNAHWCGPCKITNDILLELQDEENIKIYTINVDDNPNLTYQLNVNNIPTILFFYKEKAISKLTGLKAKQTIKEKIEELKKLYCNI